MLCTKTDWKDRPQMTTGTQHTRFGMIWSDNLVENQTGLLQALLILYESVCCICRNLIRFRRLVFAGTLFDFSCWRELPPKTIPTAREGNQRTTFGYLSDNIGREKSLLVLRTGIEACVSKFLFFYFSGLLQHYLHEEHWLIMNQRMPIVHDLDSISIKEHYIVYLVAFYA